MKKTVIVLNNGGTIVYSNMDLIDVLKDMEPRIHLITCITHYIDI